ncbi:hypothetical protein P7C73_g5763, partial [Tremellales sp. Uapishka_1]
MAGTTDLEGWRLKVSEDSHGQHKWRYLPPGPERDECAQTTAEKYFIGLDTGTPELEPPTTPLESARNGLRFYKNLQAEDGHFPSEYGGPLFLIPGLVIALHVTGQSLKPEQQKEMKRYLLSKRRKEGGWGLHTAAPPTVYGTVMNYVALRILGMGPDEGPMTEVRGLIHKMGGATGIPTWGKVWLSILGVYEWKGLNPVPPELWLLPDWVPFAPWRWWVHVRYVYTPMSYLWATNFVAPPTPLSLALRQEIYVQPYSSIKWSAQRNNISPLDIYSPHHLVFDTLNLILVWYEKLPRALSCVPVRESGIRAAYKQVVYEDENTGYQTIGPVSKAFNMVCRYAAEGPDSDAFKKHLAKVDDFLWMGKEGLMMTGTNGSQLWDLAFLAQALSESGLAEEDEFRESVLGMLDWLDKAQIKKNHQYYKESYRQVTKGAWAFSTPEQGYTVSDCAAEGLKAVLAIQSLSYTPKAVSLPRMRDCIDVLLTMQNPSGGFASYELQRGSEKMEWLNAAEVFGNIMVDYMYPEGVCFTYATMFALESLAIAGETCATSARVQRACDFLVSKQMDDGGWGETYMSCVTGEYAQHEKSQVVQTAWSILALIYGDYRDKSVVEKATRLIMGRQKKNGEWEQEDTEGIFNKNCAIDYPGMPMLDTQRVAVDDPPVPAFKFVFCIWALGRAERYLRA